MFAYANSFGFKNERNEFIPLSERQIIQPDEMFDSICKAVKQMNKKLTIHKQILNYQTFDSILCRNPRILIIMCHGQLVRDKSGNENCHFCFENEEQPYLIDKYDEERLLDMIKSNKGKVNIDVILLSTCHSARLGKILVSGIKPSPIVVAINTTDQIAQHSTFKFNQKFLQSLIRGTTVQEAFDSAKNFVAAMPKEENRCCCCNHAHTEHCLFLDFVVNQCNQNWDRACQIFHQDTCNCYTKLLKAQTDQTSDEAKLDSAQIYISHEYACTDYEQFFKRLTKGPKLQAKAVEYASEKGYLQHPLGKYEKGRYNKKCCCQSHIVHRESDKFIIANEVSDVKLSKPIFFESMEDGEPEIF